MPAARSFQFKPGCLGLQRALPALEFWLASQTKVIGSPAVSRGRERQWLVLQQRCIEFAGGAWPEPASPSTALILSRLAKQKGFTRAV
eukprot:1160915-Pelagomonas_calceolata.AAC.17